MEFYNRRFKNGFEKIFDVKECPEGIDCFRGYAWELLSIDLKNAADDLFNSEQLNFGNEEGTQNIL